jgi:toxin FitB
MPSFLLDTNVVSELRRARPNANVMQWFDRHRTSEAYVSALVIGEIRQGIERLRERDPSRAKLLDLWLDGLISLYDGRVLPVDAEVAQEWGRLSAQRRPVVDSLMAATAKVHGLTLVTRNVSDVAGLGVPVVDPFEAPTQPRRRGSRRSSQ